jgi:hypothetical protein
MARVFILLNDQPSLDFGGMRFDDGQGAGAFGYGSPDSIETVRKIQAQPTEESCHLPSEHVQFETVCSISTGYRR